MRIAIGIIMMAMAPLIVLTGTVYTLLLPNIYESTVRIGVLDSAVCESACEHCAYTSPSFLQTEMVVLQSKPILYEVVKRLDLQREWGRSNGEILPRNVAYKILRNSVRISKMHDSVVIQISVKRDNPDEAALIANEMAVVYRDSRKQVSPNQARNENDRLGVDGKEAAPIVQLIDIAEPNRRPVSPNLFLNVLLCVVQAFVMGVIGLYLLLSGRKQSV